MSTSSRSNDLNYALMRFAESCPPVQKDSVNAFYKSKYASLDKIWTTIAPALREAGLVVVQEVHGLTVHQDNGGHVFSVAVTTALIHPESGQSRQITTSIPVAAGNDGYPTPHAVGAAITYARRYGLCGLLMIVPEDDDDANSAMPAPPRKSEPQPQVDDDEARLKKAVRDLRTIAANAVQSGNYPPSWEAFESEAERLLVHYSLPKSFRGRLVASARYYWLINAIGFAQNQEDIALLQGALASAGLSQAHTQDVAERLSAKASSLKQ